MKYLQAIKGEKVSPPPVWLMRQAGRYLPEYMELRDKYSFLDFCNTPELATEVTMQPIRRFNFDASIMFSDILVPLVPMGAELSFEKGHGPKIANQIRSMADVDGIKTIEPRESLTHVLESVRMMRAELPEETALIGFAGAPFTLACYWIEGGKPDPFANIKSMMYSNPTAFNSLLGKLADMVVDHLTAIYESGANAVQVFDTWAGIMPEHEFKEFNLPVLQRIFISLKEKGIHATYYAKNSHHLLDSLKHIGSSVISLDWRTPISQARDTFGSNIAIQGNLDPTVLLGGEDRIRSEVRRIIAETWDDGGFVFNLGHGILPMTPISAVEILLDEIRGGGLQ